MATIKAYTDIEQSRKLAEILPLESADMYYAYGAKVPDIMIGSKQDYRCYTMCWSLAALLKLLPRRLEIEDNVYQLSLYFNGLYYWNISNGNIFFEAKDKENLVDACYEMILTLHELNLL